MFDRQKILSLVLLFAFFLHPTTALGSGKKLAVGVLHDPPYIIKQHDGTWTGLNVDIWRSVAQTLGADYEFKEMTFPGLLGALRENKIDIAIDAFFVLAEREKLIDFSFAFGNTRLAVATLPEKIQHPWWAAIRTVISWGTLRVIGFLAAALFLLGFLLWLIERRQNPDHFGGGTLRGIGSGIYWVGSTLASGVCFGVALKSLPARILGLIWMLLCALALSALIASLSASLTASRSMVETVDNETLQHMHLGGVTESAEESIALKNLDGRYTLYPNEESALAAVLDGTIDGFLYDEITLQYYEVNDYRNKISVFPTRFKRYSFAFGLPKGSPLRTQVNYALLSLMETPYWASLLKRYGLEENYEVNMGSKQSIRALRNVAHQF